MAKKVIITRRQTVRNIGVAKAAAVLGVSKQAVANYVNGNTAALRPEYRKLIHIKHEN